MKQLFEISDVYMEKSDNWTSFENESELLGEICLNRIAGIAYGNLKRLPQLRTIKEFENTLSAVYNDNVSRTRLFKQNVKYLSQILKDANFRYALLKGAFLITKLYTEGYRTSNDVDILIEEVDISKCQDLLKQNGFIQGYFDKQKKEVMPATRREVILSRMNYGETVPFVKVINDHPFYVDINFSLDFKPEKEKMIVSKLLSRVEEVSFEGIKFNTLGIKDFMIHLCCHLYKEASTMEWVKERRDLQLYKFSDINVCLHECIDQAFFDKLIDRIFDYGTQKECYYTFYNIAIIYPKLKEIEGFCDMLDRIKPNDSEFMKQIIDPLNNKVYKYTIPFEEWFFVKNRLEYLVETK